MKIKIGQVFEYLGKKCTVTGFSGVYLYFTSGGIKGQIDLKYAEKLLGSQ